MTVRHIEKLWKSQAFDRLITDLLTGRPEDLPQIRNFMAGAVPAAAMTIIRLDELAQPHVPLYGQLLRLILARQDSDGGWADPPSTALCLRALMCGRGQGVAIDRGLDYLANMQKPEGIWPRIGFRRMAADPLTSAFILLQLGCEQRFGRAVRLADAINWFESNRSSLETDTRRLWDHALNRCRLFRASCVQGAFFCS